jgi:hypothetical protein
MASKKEGDVQFGIHPSLRQQNCIKKELEDKHESKEKWRQKAILREKEVTQEVERRQDEKKNAVECGIENRALPPDCHDQQRQNKKKNIKEVAGCLPVAPMNSVPQLSRRMSKRQSIVDPTYSPNISPVLATRLDVFYLEKNVSVEKSQRMKKKKKKRDSSNATAI